MYDPAVGRWLSPDPLAEKYYGISPYVFCGNNPANFIDPDGRDWVESKDGTVKWRDDVYLQISGDYSYVVGLQKGETYRGKIYRRFENIGDKTYNDVIYHPDKSITSSTKERLDIDGVVTRDNGSFDTYDFGVLAGIVAATQRSYGNPKPFDFLGIGTGYIKLKT
ncbi:MAG: hypothetical protein GX125_07255 [Bacteroidales bacterium]|jgi:uncharacterized protein RhaS with RHS repeats|nr:hypothetical protein [Bacteroidales bacterium]